VFRAASKSCLCDTRRDTPLPGDSRRGTVFGDFAVFVCNYVCVRKIMGKLLQLLS